VIRRKESPGKTEKNRLTERGEKTKKKRRGGNVCSSRLSSEFASELYSRCERDQQQHGIERKEKEE